VGSVSGDKVEPAIYGANIDNCDEWITSVKPTPQMVQRR
jgi:hypothetical protein